MPARFHRAVQLFRFRIASTNNKFSQSVSKFQVVPKAFRPRLRRSHFWLLSGVFSAFTLGKKEAPPSESLPVSKEMALKDILAEADKLYDNHEETPAYELLHKTSAESGPSDEILWRISRASCEMAKNLPEKDAKRKELMYEGLKCAKEALDLNGNNPACHKWYAIMLNYTGDYEGTKVKIQNSYVVKEHFQKAIELNPKDCTSMYCLGFWCFSIAELSWYTRKIAAVVFSSPPTSSYDEALSFFEMAEKTDPGFYSMNWLMLGKTHARLGHLEKAKEFIEKARDNPLKSADDKAANKEALELLEKLAKGKSI